MLTPYKQLAVMNNVFFVYMYVHGTEIVELPHLHWLVGIALYMAWRVPHIRELPVVQEFKWDRFFVAPLSQASCIL